jgi:hypothetical protein
MININLGTRPSILIEASPNLVGTAGHAKKAKNLIAESRQKHDLELQILLYSREGSLAHTDLNLEGLNYARTYDVDQLYQSLNKHGLPFNLAINGSPNHRRHVPFDSSELSYLDKLQNSGFKAGLRNAVTVADNALVTILREKFPELEVIASCISVTFRPNLAAFSNHHDLEYDDPNFLVKYYSHLYSIYDKVVPLPQLTNPAFLLALNAMVGGISEKTIVFLNLGCGAPLGKCMNHYNGMIDRVRPNVLVIPEFTAKSEDKHVDEHPSNCSYSFPSLELMNRFEDLRKLWSMGIYQFKIPARSSRSGRVFDFLCRFVTQDCQADTIPERPKIWGYSPSDIKLSFITNYPPSVHQVLGDFSWPKSDALDAGEYSSNTAHQIHNDLHSRALALGDQNSRRPSA